MLLSIKIAGAVVVVVTTLALLRIVLAAFLFQRKVQRSANLLKSRHTINVGLLD